MLALAESTEEVVLSIVAILVGPWGLWEAHKTWRGEEAKFARLIPEQTGRPSRMGGRRMYRSRAGAGLAFGVAGPGLALCGIGTLVASLLIRDDQADDWVGWWFIVPGIVLMLFGVFYMIVYQVFGVPDALRPPCQRGWECTWRDEKPRLVRRRAFHEHPQYRPPKPLTDWELGRRGRERRDERERRVE